MTYPLILRLDGMGQAVEWIDWQEAAHLYALERVVWTAGDNMFQLHGGRSRLTGEVIILEVNSIIAVRGENRGLYKRSTPPLNNRELFRRDRNLCMYCGKSFHDSLLTRDHIQPISRGGKDRWNNVVTACRRCNSHKSNRTPDEANMSLLAIPFQPNLAEYLVLRNRRILADQMEFLKKQFNQKHELLL